MNYTPTIVKQYANSVILGLRMTEWGYLIKQFPILFDDELPDEDLVALDKHNTFSFATCYYIGFSESRCLSILTKWYTDNNRTLTSSQICDVIKNVLIHELGHILYGHVFQQPKQGELNLNAQIVTNEIETNRSLTDNEMTDFYKDFGVSDRKQPFDSARPFISYGAINAEVKRILRQMQGKMKHQQLGQSGTAKQPDQMGMTQHAMKKLPADGPKMDVLSELGLPSSTKFSDAEDPKEKLKIFSDLVQNKAIKETLSKIKGTLAGELSKDKVKTYSRPSRKTSEDGLMSKGTKRAGNKRPNILIALDESGSMDSTAVKTAALAIRLVAKTIGRNRSDITLCKFSNSINGKAKMSTYEDLVNTYHPCGGTNFDCVYKLAIEKNADVVLCIGDGEGTLGTNWEADKLPKWIDVLITPDDHTDWTKKQFYSDIDHNGRRETYWLGNNANKIKGFMDDM